MANKLFQKFIKHYSTISILLFLLSLVIILHLNCTVEHGLAENLPGRSLRELCEQECFSPELSCVMASAFSDPLIAMCLDSILCYERCNQKEGQCIGCM